MWQIETMFISTTVVPIAAKLGRIVTYLQDLKTMKSCSIFDHVVLQGHAKNENHYFFTTKVPMATKLGLYIGL